MNKSENIFQIFDPRGKIILNADDNFFNYFRKKSLQKGLKVISFGKNPKSTFRILNNQKISHQFHVFHFYGD